MHRHESDRAGGGSQHRGRPRAGRAGTPTLFINGRKIGGLMWPDLQMVINKELEYGSAGR